MTDLKEEGTMRLGPLCSYVCILYIIIITIHQSPKRLLTS